MEHGRDLRQLPDSLNMLNTLLGKDKAGREHIIEHSQFGTLSLRIGDWKYIEPSNKPKVAWATGIETGNNPKPQLYDLRTDIGEKNNLADLNPQRVKQMDKMLKAIKNAGRTRNSD